MLNAQIYTSSEGGGGTSFQPDVLVSFERHWQWGDGNPIILGSQLGAAVIPQATLFLNFSYIEYQRQLANWDFAMGTYYANAAFAGMDSVGFHLNLELPLVERLRINGDYLSGQNGLGATVFNADGLSYPCHNNFLNWFIAHLMIFIMLNWIIEKHLFGLTANEIDYEEWHLWFDFFLSSEMTILLSGKTKTDQVTGLTHCLENTKLILDEHELALG